MTTDSNVIPALHDVTWMAAKLNRSEDWIRRAANRGDLPCHRIGRSLRFTEQDLADVLDATAVPARSIGRSRPKAHRKAS